MEKIQDKSRKKFLTRGCTQRHSETTRKGKWNKFMIFHCVVEHKNFVVLSQWTRDVGSAIHIVFCCGAFLAVFLFSCCGTAINTQKARGQKVDGFMLKWHRSSMFGCEKPIVLSSFCVLLPTTKEKSCNAEEAKTVSLYVWLFLLLLSFWLWFRLVVCYGLATAGALKCHWKFPKFSLGKEWAQRCGSTKKGKSSLLFLCFVQIREARQVKGGAFP